MMYIDSAMKQLTINTKATLRWVGRETNGLFRDAWVIVCSWKWRMAAVLVSAIAMVAILMPWDVSLLSEIQVKGSIDAAIWGKFLSIMGRTEHVTLCLFLLFLLLGLVRNSEGLKRSALALVLCVAVAGISANLVHLAVGRARPFTGEKGVLHGFTLNSHFNSFPSAHTCEAFVDATLVCMVYPPATPLAATYVASICWARMQDNQHYPSDVFAGAFWGVFCTLPIALALRRKNLGRA